jgi:hypothetical protein
MDERLARAIAMLRGSLETRDPQPTQPTTTEETTMTTATYTRLEGGAWGLRAVGVVTPGQPVEVTTRDGRVKTETVGAIVFTANGVTVATTAPAPAAPAPAAVPDLARIIIDLETALAGLKALQGVA